MKGNGSDFWNFSPFCFSLLLARPFFRFARSSNNDIKKKKPYTTTNRLVCAPSSTHDIRLRAVRIRVRSRRLLSSCLDVSFFSRMTFFLSLRTVVNAGRKNCSFLRTFDMCSLRRRHCSIRAHLFDHATPPFSRRAVSFHDRYFCFSRFSQFFFVFFVCAGLCLHTCWSCAHDEQQSFLSFSSLCCGDKHQNEYFVSLLSLFNFDKIKRQKIYCYCFHRSRARMSLVVRYISGRTHTAGSCFFSTAAHAAAARIEEASIDFNFLCVRAPLALARTSCATLHQIRCELCVVVYACTSMRS